VGSFETLSEALKKSCEDVRTKEKNCLSFFFFFFFKAARKIHLHSSTTSRQMSSRRFWRLRADALVYMMPNPKLTAYIIDLPANEKVPSSFLPFSESLRSKSIIKDRCIPPIYADYKDEVDSALWPSRTVGDWKPSCSSPCGQGAFSVLYSRPTHYATIQVKQEATRHESTRHQRKANFGKDRRLVTISNSLVKSTSGTWRAGKWRWLFGCGKRGHMVCECPDR